MALEIQISFLPNKLQICKLGKLGRDTVQPKSDMMRLKKWVKSTTWNFMIRWPSAYCWRQSL